MCGWTSGCGRKGSVKDDAQVLPGLRAPICGDGKTGAGLVLPERSSADSGKQWRAEGEDTVLQAGPASPFVGPVHNGKCSEGETKCPGKSYDKKALSFLL